MMQESCMEFERLVTAQCEALIQAIHDRREYLLEAIRMDKDTKIRILKVSETAENYFSLYIYYIFMYSHGSFVEKRTEVMY